MHEIKKKVESKGKIRLWNKRVNGYCVIGLKGTLFLTHRKAHKNSSPARNFNKSINNNEVILQFIK